MFIIEKLFLICLSVAKGKNCRPLINGVWNRNFRLKSSCKNKKQNKKRSRKEKKSQKTYPCLQIEIKNPFFCSPPSAYNGNYVWGKAWNAFSILKKEKKKISIIKQKERKQKTG